MPKKTNYIATLLYGSLAVLNEARSSRSCASHADCARVEPDEGGGGEDPILGRLEQSHQARDLHHQGEPDLRSDLRRSEQNGKPVGNGDQPEMYGEGVTPNQHKLALQFGVLDNFYDSGEVSGDGHVWSNAAIGADYLEKTWQQAYRGSERTYDFEGVVADGLSAGCRRFPT